MTAIIKNQEENVIESDITPSKKFKLPSFKKLGMAAVMIIASVQFINMVVTKDEFDFKYEPIEAIPQIPALDNQDFKVTDLKFTEEKVEPIAQLSFDSKTGSFVIEPLPENVNKNEMKNKTISKMTEMRDKMSEPLNSKNSNKL